MNNIEKNKGYRVPTFAVSNDTDNYVLIVDGYFGFIDEKEASEIFDNTEIGNSPFGCMQFMPPRTVAKTKNYDNSISTLYKDVDDKISEFTPIDITSYVKKNLARQHKKIKVEQFSRYKSIRGRIEFYKEMGMPYKSWTQDYK